MKPTGRQVAEAAMAGAERVPPILYSEEDCQAFIENTVRRAGGSIPDYRGSNDMYRSACSKIVPLNTATPLEPGMVLFIVKQDGGEPDRYKGDKLGNASHIGFYTGGRYEVVHSSSSKGSVQLSTLRNGWTHAGWLKSVDYGEGDGLMIGIAQGAKGADVKEMQQMLLDLGYSLKPYGADGSFGNVTRAAVEAFQADNGLHVTGVWMDVDREKAAYLLNEIQDFPPVMEPVDTRALLLEMKAAAERNIQIIGALLEDLV